MGESSSENARFLRDTPSPATAPPDPARTPRAMRRIFALEDLEPAARRLLPPPIFGYVAGAAETNASLLDNRVVFDEIQFVPRMLVGVADRTLDCELMG